MAPSRALGRVVSLTAVNISQLADVFAPAGRDPGTVEKGQFPEVPDERILRQRQCPAQARVTVFTRSGPLFMCGHHFRRHSAALEPLVFGAYDMLTGDPVRFRAPGRRV
jgi:hypothetical protein